METQIYWVIEKLILVLKTREYHRPVYLILQSTNRLFNKNHQLDIRWGRK